jgi:hypothetical protein
MGEEYDRRSGIACRTDLDIDHLAEVVNRTKHIAGHSIYFDVRFVDGPQSPGGL